MENIMNPKDHLSEGKRRIVVKCSRCGQTEESFSTYSILGWIDKWVKCNSCGLNMKKRRYSMESENANSVLDIDVEMGKLLTATTGCEERCCMSAYRDGVLDFYNLFKDKFKGA